MSGHHPTGLEHLFTRMAEVGQAIDRTHRGVENGLSLGEALGHSTSDPQIGTAALAWMIVAETELIDQGSTVNAGTIVGRALLNWTALQDVLPRYGPGEIR